MTSYEKLHTDLRNAAEAASGALHPGDDINDLRQAAIHLRTAVEMLDDVDVEKGEPTTPQAVLSRATAIAEDVYGHALDLRHDADKELWALIGAVEAANEAGYRGDKPDLEWYGDDVPDDGSSFN